MKRTGQEQEYVRDYHDLVTTRLLGKRYYSPLQLVSLADFADLEESTLGGFGLLQLDYSVSKTCKVLTLEIKPKYAISNGPVCDFCCTAYLKHLKGDKEFIKDFCPFDLYSLEPSRIERALKALLENSRLKIFYNGVQESRGILEMYSSLKEYLQDIIEILIKDGILEKLDKAHLHARELPLQNFGVLTLKNSRENSKLQEALDSFDKTDKDFMKFLISKSLMDVSLMIKIENLESVGSKKIGKYYYSVGVIDVQPKDFQKLAYYSQIEQEITKVTGIRHCPIFQDGIFDALLKDKTPILEQ